MPAGGQLPSLHSERGAVTEDMAHTENRMLQLQRQQERFMHFQKTLQMRQAKFDAEMQFIGSLADSIKSAAR